MTAVMDKQPNWAPRNALVDAEVQFFIFCHPLRSTPCYTVTFSGSINARLHRRYCVYADRHATPSSIATVQNNGTAIEFWDITTMERTSLCSVVHGTMANLPSPPN